MTRAGPREATMNRMRWLGGFALVAGVSTALAATSRPSRAQALETVEGSWRLVSAKANGKVIGGGHYTLSGSRYEETVEYGLGEGVAPLIGKPQVFTLRIEGGRWYHGGKESDGTVIEEVWERARLARD